jgi:hypothetical protein
MSAPDHVHLLPAPFASLQALAERWARSTENARTAVRQNASATDFAEFYEAMMPRLAEVLALLGTFKPGQMPEDVAALFYLATAFAEAAPHHELYGGAAKVPYSFDAARFIPTHGNTR